MLPSVILLVAGISISAYIGLHHLGVGLGERSDRLHLWVAAFCFASLCFAAARTMHYLALDASTAIVAMRCQLSLVLVLQWILVGICRTLARRSGERMLLPVLGGISLVSIALILTTPWFATTDTRFWTDALGQRIFWVELGIGVRVIDPIAFVMLGYVVRILWISPAIERFERRVLILGMVFYVLVGLNDSAIGIFKYRGVLLFEHSFLVLAMTFDALVIRRVQRLYQDLGREVEAQTIELSEANMKLTTALAKADEAAAARAAFVAKMSHEIRTPLNGVIGMADLLSNTRLDENQKLFASNIRSSGDALMGIVNEVLDFSRIQSGRIHLTAAPFDLAASLEDVVSRLAQRAQSKGVDIVAIMAPDIPLDFVGDRVRLEQVVTNFVGNAIKFTERGHIEVRGRIKENVFRCEVVDTGIGIAEDRLAAVFEPFEQADVSTARTHGGTGLGLAIAKQVIENMDGTIGVQSTPGQGSTFFFELPIIAEPKEPQRELADVSPFVATDDPRLRAALAAQFEALGATPQFMNVEAIGHREFPLNAIVLIDGSADQVQTVANRAGSSASIIALVRMTDERMTSGTDRVIAIPTTRASLRTAMAGIMTGQDANPESRRIRVKKPKRVRLLIAEDNSVNRIVLRHMLDILGFEHVFTENGREVVQRFSEDQAFAAILMDCQMPEVDGYEATRRIRQLEGERGWSRIPVIAVTANAIAEEKTLAFEAGMDGYLAKPFRLADLRAACQQVLAAR